MALAQANLQHDSSQWSEAHSFSEIVPVHFSALETLLNQPDQIVFRALTSERFAAHGHPMVLAEELRATSSSVFELVIKRMAKLHTAHELGLFQGPFRYRDVG